MDRELSWMALEPRNEVLDLRPHSSRLLSISSMLQGADVLVIDEPTIEMTDDRISHLLDRVAALKKEGKSVILVTHLNELASACDRRVSMPVTQSDMMLQHIATHPIITAFGEFRLSGFLFGDNQQAVMVLANLKAKTSDIPLVRVQYGCMNGTVFRATDCDCALQIEASIRRIAASDPGVFIYFADHEGFGLGLAGKMQVVAEEKRTRRTFLEVLKSNRLPDVSSDVLWVVPRVLDLLTLQNSIVLLGRNGRKLKRLQQF